MIDGAERGLDAPRRPLRLAAGVDVHSAARENHTVRLDLNRRVVAQADGHRARSQSGQARSARLDAIGGANREP